MTRWAWWLLAYGSLALGMLGIVVPGLPTVPFVLLAAYAAARGSQRLRDWLLAHPRYGRMIGEWEMHGVVRRAAKCWAIGMMLLSATLLWVLAPLSTATLGTAVMAAVGLWLWQRPEHPRQP